MGEEELVRFWRTSSVPDAFLTELNLFSLSGCITYLTKKSVAAGPSSDNYRLEVLGQDSIPTPQLSNQV